MAPDFKGTSVLCVSQCSNPSLTTEAKLCPSSSAIESILFAIEELRTKERFTNSLDDIKTYLQKEKAVSLKIV